ncbi:hypothetical protein AwErysi_00280 [Erysipelotrichaceae bacterium]|nr:hypothetical protein AwErysi_00280 [Erysipelotrichaceae bacterium]
MRKKTFFPLFKYEFLTTINNFFTPFFGIAFPVLMGLLLTQTVPFNVPDNLKAEVATSIIISVSISAVFSVMLVAFPSSYSQDVENNIAYRIELFGFSHANIILAKLLAHYIILTFSLLIFIATMMLTTTLLIPKLSVFLIYVFCLYLLASILFVFSYSVSNIFKKFSYTYAVTLGLFFLFMLISGMMGVSASNLPHILKFISSTFPFPYISTDFIDYWTIGFSGYNFAPLIQGYLFFAAITGVIYFISSRKKG